MIVILIALIVVLCYCGYLIREYRVNEIKDLTDENIKMLDKIDELQEKIFELNKIIRTK